MNSLPVFRLRRIPVQLLQYTCMKYKLDYKIETLDLTNFCEDLKRKKTQIFCVFLAFDFVILTYSKQKSALIHKLHSRLELIYCNRR